MDLGFGDLRQVPQTRVVNIRHEAYDIWGARPGPLGNPFRIGRDGNRNECIVQFRQWVVRQPFIMRLLPDLAGRTIGCFCKPLACHCDVYVELLHGG